MKTGRPVTKAGAKAKRHRDQARKWYQKQSSSKRTSLVKNRSSEAQRKADAKRLSSQRSARNTYHREQARAVSGAPKPSKCSRCGSTSNVERHHSGGKVIALCAKCHAKVRGAA
jgi:hypothetical protein